MSSSTSDTEKIHFLERLSGGNHELFHSNLLAYLAEYHEEYFKCLFSWINNFPSYSLDNIGREKLKIDLCLISNISKDCDKIVFALENKMKSFPNKEQLLRYSQKIINHNKNRKNKDDGQPTHCVLLTLFDPKIDEIITNDLTWHVMTYEQLAKIMEENIAIIKGDSNSYLKSFLIDYIAYIKWVNGIVKEAESFVECGEHTMKDLNLLLSTNNKTDKDKLKDSIKARAIYYFYQQKLEKEINNPKVKYLVTISHTKPLVELQVYLKKEAYKKLEENDGSQNKKEEIEKLNYYFLIFQDSNILRGFRVRDPDASKYKKKKGKRGKCLKTVWNKTLESPEGKKIESASETISKDSFPQIEIKKNKNNKQKKEVKKYPAFVFEKSAMPHLIEKLNEDMKINAVLEKLKTEIISIADTLYKTKEN